MTEVTKYWLCRPHEPEEWRTCGYELIGEYDSEEEAEANMEADSMDFVLAAHFEFSDAELIIEAEGAE